MKKWLWKLTGGRPMIFIRNEFHDHIVDRPVNSYMDRNGKYWMAFTPWDWDRLRMRGDQVIAALQKRDLDLSSYLSPSDMQSQLWSCQLREEMDHAVDALDALLHTDISSPDDDD